MVTQSAKNVILGWRYLQKGARYGKTDWPCWRAWFIVFTSKCTKMTQIHQFFNDYEVKYPSISGKFNRPFDVLMKNEHTKFELDPRRHGWLSVFIQGFTGHTTQLPDFPNNNVFLIIHFWLEMNAKIYQNQHDSWLHQSERALQLWLRSERAWLVYRVYKQMNQND